MDGSRNVLRSKAEVIKTKEKDRKGRRGMAPHWFKGTIMQLLVFSQTPSAAQPQQRGSEGYSEGGDRETRPPNTSSHPPIPDPRPPHQPKLSALSHPA